ncbi:MerR family transcriptional regulator [Holdemania massiliensis]|uniref:MerR family transcriptional regulator n=1 Tax=Holdemania massiliensis TaxID=1468449 RepID=A0A6N7S7R7_9FIRM|nr:MerR family transcriptional regulator [Holdemania massiliensis]MSA71453.1 MerR family transcriptional regulator [Holdemania massiliensis]MSA89702.1 MerR family transcriptional regulator [Holdemania massiliensis]MSB78533.1 MerR family transcriptional regulator [Holdemania massiliensis]MSC33457.1 MerR family transcriptional regulator [Holdemania massiliensis]MSC39848.1 MerR family transcriptional regulator [Holdemania massiliensis]
MKNQYKIHQICQLYHIGADSLRYYEKMGLIQPQRSDGNYRLYSLSDIWRLNVIRDLLKLGFSTQQIKTYLDSRSVATTRHLLDEKEAILRQRIEEMKKDLQDVQNRRQSLEEALSEPMNQVRLRTFPKRRCLLLKEKIEHDEDIDYLLTKLSGRLEEQLSILGNVDTGSILEPQADGTVRCTSVFICTEDESYDFTLEEGQYLTLTYSGRYDTHDEHLRILQEAIQKRKLKAVGQFLEFLLIDIHETQRYDEYVTQLQVRVVAE